MLSIGGEESAVSTFEKIAALGYSPYTCFLWRTDTRLFAHMESSSVFHVSLKEVNMYALRMHVPWHYRYCCGMYPWRLQLIWLIVFDYLFHYYKFCKRSAGYCPNNIQ